MRSAVLFLAGFVLWAGCATDSPQRPEAFSDAWTEEQRRKPPPQVEETTLVGRKGKARAYLYQDEKGRPKIGLEGTGGLSADLDIEDGGPDVRVKYKKRFGADTRRFEYEPIELEEQAGGS